MTYQSAAFEEFVGLAALHAPQEGVNLTAVPDFATFKASTTQIRKPVIDVAALFIVGQGRKNCYVGKRVFDYSPGKALVSFVWSPFAVDKNVILIAATDAKGLRAGADRLVEIMR